VTVQTPSVLAGRYDLGPALGSGGMAQVFRAEDTVLGRTVAVKIFRLDVEGAEIARVEREMQTLARLNHPGLVAVYDAGGLVEDGGASTPYLVMELVEGPTFAQCCSDGSLGADEIARMGAELADTLAYVHAEGVVHRDVKPANILLAGGTRTKLADFGVALLADAARHTQAGLTIGTAPYLSPEQVLGTPVGPAADVYSLGLVLLEALTGRREYQGNSTETALARLHRQPEVPADAPEPLHAVLTAMLAKEPQDRPSAADVSTLLAGTDDSSPPATRVLTTAVPVEPERSRSGGVVREVLRESVPRRSFLVGISVLALAAVGVVAALVVGGPDPGTPDTPATEPATQLEQDLADLQRAVTR
jgi:serine/threonine protein kinase